MGVLSVNEAQETLYELRKGRGGGRSKYADLLDEIDDMNKNQVYEMDKPVDGYSGVQSIRSAINRRFGDDVYEVVSSRLKGEEKKESKNAKYKVFIAREGVL